MAIFATYAPPGVYVTTLEDVTEPTLTAGIRLPVFVGVGTETLNLSNFEIIRGSSATADIQMIGENESNQFNGLNRQFQVRFYPIVDGNGTASVTNDPNSVKVEVDGQPVQVVAVDGMSGKVTLGIIPEIGSNVTSSYYFARTDTKITDENLSNQADGTNAVFKVQYSRIVSGNNGGVTTTDPSLVSVTVNGSPASIKAVNGADRLITLAAAPAAGATVLATYYTNSWQDTWDYLPQDITITNVDSVGNSPGGKDYFQGTDFVVETTNNTIQWGTAFSIHAGLANTGVPFDTTQISGTLVDNHYYMRPVSGLVDGTNKTFYLETVPVDGTGVGAGTDRLDLVSIYVGTTVASALAAGPVATKEITYGTKQVVLKNAPAVGHNVYASYYYNLLTTDTFTLACTLPSVMLTPGTYTVSSATFGPMMFGKFNVGASLVAAPAFSTEGITFPNGIEDTQTVPKYSVAETVSLTFVSSNRYVVTSSLLSGGSAGSGWLNQTYVDSTTGLRFTVMDPVSFSYQSGDVLVLNVGPSFTTGATPVRSVPGYRLSVSDTNGVAIGSTGLLNTYRLSGNEPTVGDSYFVDLQYEKTDFTPQVYTSSKAVQTAFGDLTVDNALSLASYLAFLNGCPAIAAVQVRVGSDGLTAPDSAYFAAFDSLETPMPGDISPNFLVPLTTSVPVIQYQKKHCEKVSTARYALERTGIYGYAVGTTPENAQALAKSLKTERMMGVYPDGAVMTLTDAFGKQSQFTVDGSYLAAATAGLACNPAFDVATPLTRKGMVGFDRLFRTLDAVQSNQSATAGLTVLVAKQSSIVIRQALTTDQSTVLSKEPTIVFIKDYVQQQTRQVLDGFIGQKFLAQRLTDIEIALTNMFKALIQAEIIVAYNGIKAIPDPLDPSQADVVAHYSPVFPLNWIQVKYTISSSLSG